MAKNKTKTLMLNTLLLVFCCVIIALYCLNPAKESSPGKVFKLSFDSEGGSSVAALEVPECEKVTQPPNPTRDGYEFVGWMLGDELYDFSQGVCGDIELKASWKEAEPVNPGGDKTYFNLSFNVDGGTEIPSIQVEDGTVPSRPADPYKEGFTFDGWTLDGEPYYFDEPITGDATLYAVWVPNAGPVDDAIYKVTFNLNGGKGTTPEPQEVKSGEKATVPQVEEPTREKYKFVGWSTSKSATRANIQNATIKRDTVFYAAWESTVKSYTVTIDLAGGKASNCKTKQTVEENQNPKGCSSPTKSDGGFDHWTDGTNSYSNLSQFVITKNTTIKAVWTQQKYSIVYTDAPGCSNSTPSGGYTYQFNVCNSVKAPTFKHLTNFTDSNGKTYKAGEKVTLQNTSPNISLKANYADNTYKIQCEFRNDDSGVLDETWCYLKIVSSYDTKGLTIKFKSGAAIEGNKVMKTRYNSKGTGFKVCSGDTCVDAVKEAVS